MELAVGAVKPSSRAAMLRSRASVAPATAPEPSGQKLRRAAQSLQASGVAQNHFDVGEKPVGDEHGLGALQVGVAGHDGFAGGVGLLDEGVGPGGERVDDELDVIADVEAQVGGDLLVAAAAGVELEAERADALDEFEFDEVMDVFGGGVVAHLGLAGFGGVVGGDGVQRCADLRAFIFR